jgi:hypothetical protein
MLTIEQTIISNLLSGLEYQHTEALSSLVQQDSTVGTHILVSIYLYGAATILQN